MTTAYCVKCKKKKKMAAPKAGRVGKRSAMKGKCPTCGTKMVRFMAKAAKKTAKKTSKKKGRKKKR